MEQSLPGEATGVQDDILPELRALRTTLECLKAKMRRTPPHAKARINSKCAGC